MGKLQALVIAAREGTKLVASIVTAHWAMTQDIDDNYNSRNADDSIGLPPEPGPWIWEGTIEPYESHEGDRDEWYTGEYRRLTADEVEKLLKGESMWEWDEPPEVGDGDG